MSEPEGERMIRELIRRETNIGGPRLYQLAAACFLAAAPVSDAKVEALRWYADPAHWDNDGTAGEWEAIGEAEAFNTGAPADTPEWEFDNGDRARKALAADEAAETRAALAVQGRDEAWKGHTDE